MPIKSGGEMRKSVSTKIMTIRLLLALGFVLAFAGFVAAADFYLVANATTLTMPDTNETIVMWGFANADSSGAQIGPVTVPGPVLRVPPGDNTLNIHLFNRLSEPVSIQIPGLTPASQSPVKVSDSTGRQRAVSLAAETPPGNATAVTYTWNSVRAGTHMYMSATNPAKQVQMGLYGAVIKDSAAGEAYSGVLYDNEVIVFYSEIDPVIHDAVATGNYGPGKAVPSSVNYDAKYFLVNGAPYPSSSTIINAGNSGNRTLIRFLNASLETHVPLLQGMYMSWVAEDGWLLPYPQERYALSLPAGKTMDVVITPQSGGKYPLYDRRLNLTNYTKSGGGMLAYLGVDMHLLRVLKAGWGSGTVTSTPSGINCGYKCAELFDNTVTSVTLSAQAATGSVFLGWSGDCTGTGPTCVVTLDADKTVTATFDGAYTISGSVRTPLGSPIAGATITLGGAVDTTVITDASGNYSITGLINGDYTITPSLTGYSFTPAQRIITIGGVSLSQMNFIGTTSTPMYSISGMVSGSGGEPVPEVTLTLSGDLTRTAVTGPLGQYVFKDLPNGSYTVTPSKAGYTFTPVSSSALIIDGADITGVNFSVASSTPTYTISGYVRTAGGAPISGINVELVGIANTTTDVRGAYSFSGLSNGSYILIPSGGGYTFSPSSLNLTVSGGNIFNQNFTATSGVGPVRLETPKARPVLLDGYTISGRVLAKDGTPVEGTKITLSGDAESEVLSDSKGYYRFVGLNSGSYRLRAEKSGITLSPEEIEVTINGSNVRGRNFRAE